MASLTFYGGVGEIGGNKVLLQEGDTRIWLDFGMSFPRAGRYFAEFLQPRKCSGIGDLLEFGLLPDLQGLYREDYERRVREPQAKAYDAVFLSHAHADHSAHVHFLRRDIPVYASEVTKQILRAIEVTAATGFAEFLTMKRSFELVPKKREEGMKKLVGWEAEVPRSFEVIKGKVTIGDLEVEALPINHSLPGACGYIVHTPGGSLVYTGDFRFHGYGGDLTREFAKRAAEAEPEVMLCEGTRISEKGGMTEAELKERVSSEMDGVRGLVVVNFPVRDIDRMNSFHEAAREHDRRLVVNPRQAYLLKLLEPTDSDAPKLEDVCVFLPRKEWGIIGDPAYPPEIVRQDYMGWEREFLERENSRTAEDLRSDPGRYVFRCDFFELKNLIDVRPPKGSVYIRSVTEPFDEEMAIDKRKADEWLRHFSLYPYRQIHCSGHASGPEVREFVRGVGPKRLFPVHTEHPRRFRGLAGRVHERVRLGKAYKI